VNILVVAPQPFFSPRGTPMSVYYRTRVTRDLGHDVDLLTYGEGKDVDIRGCRVVRIPAFRWLGPVRVGPSLGKLFRDCFMIAWTVMLLARRRYDVVHVHEEAVFWCRWLKPLFGFRLIYDMHSSLPQQLSNFGLTRLRFLHRLLETLEAGSVRTADVVITICPALRDYAMTLTPEAGKIVLVENSLFDPIKFAVPDNPGPQASTPTAADEWFGKRCRERVLAYAGTLEPYQGIDKLLEAFSIVVARVPGASLLIIGGLPRQVERFRHLADSLRLGDSVHFSGQLSQPEAQRLVASAAAAISPRLAGNNTPMKIYQLMADGVPLVATRIESHTQVLNDEIAILADVSTTALTEAMLRALSNPEETRAMAKRAQEWYRREYSRDVYTAKMRKVFSLVA
jgi:glycosyltransferase involved in cell wall biosynthesis